MPVRSDSFLFTVRILRIGFIVAAFLFLYVCYAVPSTNTRPIDPTFEYAIIGIAFINVLAGFFAPRLFARTPIRPSAVTQKASPEQQRWFSTFVISMALFTSCNLLGVVLHNLGAGWKATGLLFAVGIASLLLWNPGPPPSSAENDPIH